MWLKSAAALDDYLLVRLRSFDGEHYRLVSSVSMAVCSCELLGASPDEWQAHQAGDTVFILHLYRLENRVKLFKVGSTCRLDEVFNMTVSSGTDAFVGMHGRHLFVFDAAQKLMNKFHLLEQFNESFSFALRGVEGRNAKFCLVNGLLFAMHTQNGNSVSLLADLSPNRNLYTLPVDAASVESFLCTEKSLVFKMKSNDTVVAYFFDRFKYKMHTYSNLSNFSVFEDHLLAENQAYPIDAYFAYDAQPSSAGRTFDFDFKQQVNSRYVKLRDVVGLAAIHPLSHMLSVQVRPLQNASSVYVQLAEKIEHVGELHFRLLDPTLPGVLQKLEADPRNNSLVYGFGSTQRGSRLYCANTSVLPDAQTEDSLELVDSHCSNFSSIPADENVVLFVLVCHDGEKRSHVKLAQLNLTSRAWTEGPELGDWSQPYNLLMVNRVAQDRFMVALASSSSNEIAGYELAVSWSHFNGSLITNGSASLLPPQFGRRR